MSEDKPFEAQFREHLESLSYEELCGYTESLMHLSKDAPEVIEKFGDGGVLEECQYKALERIGEMWIKEKFNDYIPYDGEELRDLKTRQMRTYSRFIKDRDKRFYAPSP